MKSMKNMKTDFLNQSGRKILHSSLKSVNLWPLSAMCHSAIAVTWNASMKQIFSYDYPPKTELRKNNLTVLKSSLNRQRRLLTMFSKKADTTTGNIARAKRLYSDGEFVREEYSWRCCSVRAEYHKSSLIKSTNTSFTLHYREVYLSDQCWFCSQNAKWFKKKKTMLPSA